MKILSLVGARPQFIKEALINQELKKNNIEEILVHSGQHYDYEMSDVFFETLNVSKPQINLEVGSGSHAEMTAKIMVEFEKVLQNTSPDKVIVYGDTNTTLAGALVAAKLKIPIAHIEAGIRMHPKTMPEEINRVLVDSISQYLFCPTELAVSNLKTENITENVINSGDIMYDLYKKLEPQFNQHIHKNIGVDKDNFTLVTIHRDYNVDDKENLNKIIDELIEVNKVSNVIIPLHPRTKARLQEFNLLDKTKGLKLIKPLGYFDLMGLLKKCRCVITDSGGLQKEAYFASKPALILMPDTGWKELLSYNQYILTDSTNIFSNFQNLHPENIPENIYGNGTAANVIIQKIINS